jgi:hypothetical protein
MSDDIETDDDDMDETPCDHDWEENCGVETNHRNCSCGYFCTWCGANSRD